MNIKLTDLVPPRESMTGEILQSERIRSAGWNACREATLRKLRRMKALPAPGAQAEPKIEVFRICEHCNQEYKLAFGPTGISNFGPCPICGERDDPWIRVARATEAKR